MAELSFDVVEQILVLLDVKDLIRCKSVCKSWQSLISAPSFVIAHLKHAYKSDRDNNELGHRRIYEPLTANNHIVCSRIVGSCNGLVCVFLRAKFQVTNPSTRELKKLPSMPPYWFRRMRKVAMTRKVIMGFGYDAGADDYKVIVGFRKNLDIKWTIFCVLTMKSNTWKVIGKINYQTFCGKSGILFGGALHWLMIESEMSYVKAKKVIISFDLSTEEFREILLPDDHKFFFNGHRLGVFGECLCIYSIYTPLWVMKNNKWEELYLHDHCRTKYDVVHCLPLHLDTQKWTSLEDIDGTRVHNSLKYICDNIFVKSLVSPRLHNNNNKQGKRGTIRKRKRKRKN